MPEKILACDYGVNFRVHFLFDELGGCPAPPNALPPSERSERIPYAWAARLPRNRAAHYNFFKIPYGFFVCDFVNYALTF